MSKCGLDECDLYGGCIHNCDYGKEKKMPESLNDKTTPTKAIDECRAEFERWARDEGSYDLSQNHDGDYIKPDTWELYCGWQTAYTRNQWRSIETIKREDYKRVLGINMNGKGPHVPFIMFSEPVAEGKTWAVGAGWREPGRDWPSYPTHWAEIPAPNQPAGGGE